MSNTKTAIAFERFTSSDSSGYTHTTISINLCYVETLVEALEGTVDNKAGYGSQVDAQAIGREFQGLIDEGYETRLTTTMSGVNVRINYQHYKLEDGVQSYCEPSMKVGERLDVMERGMKFLKRLGGIIERRRGRSSNNVGTYTFKNPDTVMEVLRAMRVDRQKTIETEVVGGTHFRRLAKRKLPKVAA